MTAERRIEIRYPLPMDVAGSLMTAIGTMWPGATIDTRVSHSLSIVLPDKQRAAKRTAKKALRATVDEDPIDSDIISFDGQTLTASAPEDVQDKLAYLAYTMLTNADGATNYVEMEVTEKDTGKKLVFSCAWSKGQTPHQLRMAAEKRADDLQRELDELKAAR